MIGSQVRLVAVAGFTALLAGLVIPTSAAARTAPPRCGNHSLRITATPTDSGLGHRRFVLLYRNSGSRACTLHGYPGLDAIGARGRVLAHARRTPSGYMGGGDPRATITIPPHGYASATVEWLAFDRATGRDCRRSTSVATIAANTTRVAHLPVSVGVCVLQVHPTVRGTTGFGDFAAAQLAWIHGASAISAEQGRFWLRAARDLARAGYGYRQQCVELRRLAALPDADQTPAQHRTWLHDIRALNNFFNTGELYL